MKITGLKLQQRNPGRVNVFVEGKFAFSLTQDQILENSLKTGLELDAQRLKELKKASDFGKAYDRALNYALLRPHSEREMRDYGRRKNWPPEDSQIIIERLKQRGYLDDERFARAWLESRRASKQSSARRLRQELKQKGVTEDIINKTLGESGFDEQAALRLLAAKKLRLARYANDPQKLMQYLARQGFSYEDIKAVLPKKPDSQH